MTEVRLEIPGRPIPWQRVRTNQGRFFTPKETRDYEEAVAMLSRATRQSLGETPCEIDIELYPTKAIVTITPLPDAPKRKLQGDVDNYAKAILDGLQKGQMIENDKQVQAIRVTFPSD